MLGVAPAPTSAGAGNEGLLEGKAVASQPAPSCVWRSFGMSVVGFYKPDRKFEDAILLLEAVGGGMWTSLCRYCSNTSVEKRHHDIRRGGMNQKGDMCTSTDLLTRYCNVINIVKGYEHLERSLR